MFRKIIVSFVVCYLSVANVATASEQKIVFKAERIRKRIGTLERDCQQACAQRSTDVEPMLSSGWKIISSSPKEIIAIDYYYIPGTSTDPEGCSCSGTEYVMQKDTPADSATTSKSAKEVELLKKEVELQKQEIALLKKDNKRLRDQLKLKQERN